MGHAVQKKAILAFLFAGYYTGCDREEMMLTIS